jgi:hypothetical protein
MTAYFIVCAKVADAAEKHSFDRWYAQAVSDAYAQYPNDEYMMEHAIVLNPDGCVENAPPRPSVAAVPSTPYCMRLP